MGLFDFLEAVLDTAERMAGVAVNQAERRQGEINRQTQRYSNKSERELREIANDSNRSSTERYAALQQHKQRASNASSTRYDYRSVELMKGPGQRPAASDEELRKRAQKKLEQRKKKEQNRKNQAEQNRKNNANQTKPNNTKAKGRSAEMSEEDKDFEELIRASQEGLTEEEILENMDIFELVDDEYDDGLFGNYREAGRANTKFRHGWYRCPKCGKSYRLKDLDADHIIPKSKGGDNSRYNIQFLCKHCNRSKQADTSDTEEDLKRRAEEIYRLREERFAEANFIAKVVKEEVEKEERVLAEIKEKYDSSSKYDAIKYYKQEMGYTLKEAREAVEEVLKD